jgi:hypothetical protein
VKLVSTLGNILARPVRVVLVATMAVPGLILAASPPASASVGLHLCETFGSYCIGAPSLGLYNPVVETASGRLLEINPVGTGNQRELAFASNPSECVAADNDGDLVVIHPCNGGSGVVWLEGTGSSGGAIYESREFSGLYLSGADNGTQFQLKDRGASGWYQQFTAGT